jgi:outer membrane protein TolC
MRIRASKVSAIAGVVLVGVALAPRPLRAEDAQPIDLRALRHGASAFPVLWKPYRPMPLPAMDLRNGALLRARLAAGTLQLSMREFLELVVENDLDVHAARYDDAIAQLDVLRAMSGQAARGTSSSPLPAALFAGAIGAGVSSTAALSAGGTGGAAITTAGKLVTLGPRGNFDPTVSMNLSYDHLVNPLNTRKVAGAADVVVPSTVLQTRFQQELPYGTSYSVSFNLQRQASTQANLQFNPALTSFAAIQLYQPLLNGFGLALTQRFVTVADNDRQIVREAFHTTLNNTLSAAANAYWDLTALRENVRVLDEAVAIAQQTANEDRSRVAIGVMTDLDVLTAESQLASTRAQLVDAQTRVQQQEAVLKSLMARADDPVLDRLAVEPTDPLPGPAPDDLAPTTEAIARALTARSSIKSAELSLKNQRIAQEYTRKNLLPTLSAFVAVNIYGLAPDTDPALRQLVQWTYPEYSVGMTWSFPVFNRSAQADDVRARIEAEQAETALQRTRRDIVLQVETATVGVNQDRAQVVAAARAVVFNRTAFEGEQERLRFGLSTPLRVTLAQRDLTAAEFAEVQARVNYAKALVANQIAVGSFLEQIGVDSDAAQHGTLLKDSRQP